MLNHSLLSLEFTTMVIYGLLSVPLYIATIVIILKKKTLKGSFYTIYIAAGVANIIQYINKFFSVRFPLFTCGSDCPLRDYFYNTRYFWLIPVIFIHWHVSYTQFWMTPLMAFDRFVVIVLGLSRHWKKVYIWMIIFVYIGPLIFSINVLSSTAKYEYNNATDNFRYSITGDLYFMYDSMFVVMLITCGVSFFFNFTVFLQFFCGKLKIPGYQRKTEIKLFVNCVIDMTLQMSCAGVTHLQKNMRMTDPEVYDFSRALVVYAVDAMTVVPPFILVFTCAEVRESVRVIFCRKRGSAVSSEADNSRVIINVVP